MVKFGDRVRTGRGASVLEYEAKSVYRRGSRWCMNIKTRKLKVRQATEGQMNLQRVTFKQPTSTRGCQDSYFPAD